MRLYPSADSYAILGDPNHGTQVLLLFGNIAPLNVGKAIRSFLRFDLSDVPVGAVTAASLVLTGVVSDLPVGSSTFTAHQISNDAWVESTVTWTVPWTTAGGDFGAAIDTQVVAQAAASIAFDVTAEVLAAAGGNWAVALKGLEGETLNRYFQAHSRESATAAARPYLEITLAAAATIGRVRVVPALTGRIRVAPGDR